MKKEIDKINITFLKQYHEFNEFQNINKKEENQIIENKSENEDFQQDPLTTLLEVQNTINQALADDLMDLIMTKDPYFFERIVVEL